MSLREILAWRSLESLRAESLRMYYAHGSEGGRQVSHYVISIRHPHSTFHNLLFRENSVRIYLSYPISESRKTGMGIKEINGFRAKMHSLGKKHGLVVFDPVAIDELCIKFALDRLLAKTPKERQNEITSVRVTQNDRWPICLDDLVAPDIPLPVTMSTFYDRLRLQKLAYLAQELGAGDRYFYSWYVHGPYSSPLTSALFLGEELGKFSSRPALTEGESAVVSRLKSLLGKKISNPSKLELFASIWYLLPPHRISAEDREMVLKVMCREKPHFTRRSVESALTTIIDFRKSL